MHCFRAMGALAIVGLFLASAAVQSARPRPATRPAATQPKGGDGPIVIDPGHGDGDEAGPSRRLPLFPATRPAAKITKEAQAALDQIGAAYAKLNTLDLAGSIAAEFDVAGQKQSNSAQFTSSYQSPNKFRHELKEGKDDQLLVGSTGKQVYAYSKKQNSYIATDAPQEKVATGKLPTPLPQLLPTQNPSLALALAKEPARELLEDASEVTRQPDAKVGEISYTALQVTSRTTQSLVTVLIDPSTHLIRRMSMDLKPVLVKRGAPDVKVASLTIDYTATRPGAQTTAEQFAWAPPAGAKDARAAGEADQPEGQALVGQDAPDFKLDGLDGKPVSLADLKGSVVVLDFWATWCPPCRKGLPHVQKLHADNKAAGLKVFAINQQEEKEKVQNFLKGQNLSLPVLLDATGEVGVKYKVEGIPQTVIIGKDGKVRKVIVGFSDELAQELDKAVAAELTGKPADAGHDH